MSNAMLDALATVSVVLILLLLARTSVLRFYGPRQAYNLWFAVPVCMIGSWLPELFTATIPVNQMAFYTVANGAATNTDYVGWVDYALATYLLGAGLGLIALVRSGIIHRASNLNSQERLNSHFNIPVGLPVYACKQTNSPALVGFLNPVIIVPTSFFEQFNDGQRKAIIQHELYHHHRKDIFWNILAYCVVITFWFNPLVWVAYRKFRQDQELSCDEAVLRHTSLESKQDYARALLQLHCHTPTMPLQLSFGQQGNETMIKERLKSIKNSGRYSKGFAILTIGLMAAFSAVNLQAEVSQADKGLSADAASILKPVVRVNPSYPAQAAEQGIEGWVVLEFGVTSQGTVENIRVIESHPSDVFDEEAKRALVKWRYVPKEREQQVNTVELTFKL